jgi:alkylhydroperoxidase/carboxymuconolactone decarboxylase family protein YurZ
MQAPVHATMPAPGSERMMTHAPTMMPSKVASAIRKYAAGFTITPEARSNLPKKDFAVSPKKSNTGKEAYPIPDRRHAGIALGFSKMHGDTADYEAVRAKVKAKYPDMLDAHDKRHAAKEKNAALSDHALELAGLGVLSAPSIDEFQAHARARLAGDKGKGAVEKREFLPSVAKPISEIGGLGTLAVPAYRAIRSHAA